MSWFDDNGFGVTDPTATGGYTPPNIINDPLSGLPGTFADPPPPSTIQPVPPGGIAPAGTPGTAPAGTGGGIPWAPGASQPSGAPPGYTWDAGQARFVPSTGATGSTAGGPPTLNRNDPASVAAYVQYYSMQPGANPSLARDPNYWIQKITSGELGDDPGYIVSKFMLPEGAPAGSGGSLGSLGFGGYIAPFEGQFSAPTAAQAEQQPGYQFARDQALQGVQRSAASKGTLLTGGTLKDLAGYAGGIASQNYNNLFNQSLQAFNTNRDTFYHNQDSPFNKLYSVSALGRPTAP